MQFSEHSSMTITFLFFTMTICFPSTPPPKFKSLREGGETRSKEEEEEEWCPPPLYLSQNFPLLTPEWRVRPPLTSAERARVVPKVLTRWSVSAASCSSPRCCGGAAVPSREVSPRESDKISPPIDAPIRGSAGVICRTSAPERSRLSVTPGCCFASY